jgi:Na+-translocating ferredoxin:NAD+ oxidoreductase RnfD subunit
MDTTIDKRVVRLSALWYTGISLGVVGVFLILARVVGGYPPAAIYGGAVWSFLLSMIVTMPVITAYVKRRARAEA